MKPKDIEARHQTQQKLEAMERYFGAWCSILAQARGYRFCPTRLWLIDTHAGTGLHLSEADPDGRVPGSPILAVLAARAAQRRFPDIEVRVRATDRDKSVARDLERVVSHYRGSPPEGVDVTVSAVDWVDAIDALRAEISAEDHPHDGQSAPGAAHQHRSLWFVDPFGIESLNHAAIERFPTGSEVIVNLDLMGTLRHIGKAGSGDPSSATLLHSVFGDDRWRRVGGGARAREPLADAFADSFRPAKWTIARWHLLRPSGSQDRALVHLTNSTKAADTFERMIQDALKAGTIIAGRTLTTIEKDRAAERLFGLFAGLSVQLDDMHLAGPYDRGQLRVICRRADERGYGAWTEKAGSMEWYLERRPAPTLWDSADAG